MTFEANWLSYWEAMKPDEFGQVQFMETRRAFFAGGWAMLTMMQRLGESDVSVDAGAFQLEIWEREMKAFLARIGDDR